MKKILLIILIMTSLIILPTDASAESEKITIYLFRREDCAHCEQALNYISNHLDKIPDNIEVITYEVFNNAENIELQDQVADYLEVDKTKNYGTPFFVVGTEYIKGYGTGTWEELFEIAEEYAKNGEYEDVVEKIIKEEKLDVDAVALSELYSEPNKMVTIIVYVVFGLIVLGFVAMIVFSRK